MKGRSLLALPVLVLAFACEGEQSPTGPKSVPFDPSDVIQDGAHGGNPDFWFLPPMVPFPRHQDFVLGTFNNAVRPSLRVEICELRDEYLSALGIPTNETRCKAAHPSTPDIAAPPIKTFLAGTVNLVNLPRRQHGWWSLFGLPADGFYYVLWNTRQSNLDRSKFYRITVMIKAREGDAPVVLGKADVDPMPNLREWRHARTGEVVQMIDDVLLPIPFRVEDGALCEGADLCTSVTVTNNTDGVNQIVQLPNASEGVIAGASIPDCVLPGPGCEQAAAPGAIQSFVLNISQVATGGASGFASNAANNKAQSAPTVCHPAPFPLQQFEGCFNFTTTPALPAINEAGDVFLNAVTVAVCFELVGNTIDPRVPFVQLYASDPGEEPRLLPDASDIGILTTPSARDCTFTGASNNSTGVMGLASAGWRKLQGGFGRMFGVKTAYALDAGIAGLVKRLSNVGPALTADIQSNSDGELVLDPEELATSSVSIVGRPHHEGDEPTSLAGLEVTFTLESDCGGSLSGTEGNSFTTTTNVDGVASVNWALTSGSCTLTATGQAFGSSTFSATVADEALPNPVLAFTGTEIFTVNGVNFVRYLLGVTNYEAYPAEMFALAPDLPRCGGTPNGSLRRTWVDIHDASDDSFIFGFCAFGSPSNLQSMFFARPAGALPPQVYIRLIDRVTGVTYQSNTVVPVRPPFPDLYFSAGSPMSITPSTVTSAGGTVTLSGWTVANGGGNFQTADGTVHHGIYLSVDPFITAADVLLSTHSNLASDLQAGESFPRGSGPLAIPALEPGTYYLGMLIDRTNAVAEETESNNTLNAVLTVTAPAPALPDLVISSGTLVVTPAQVTTSHGGIVILSPTTVSNLGGSFTLGSGVRFGVYLSTDATITSADQLVGSANIPPGSLEAGGTFNLPFPVGNIPAGVAAGSYFLGFLIDDNGAVAESDEGNNFVSAPFTVVSSQRMLSMQTGATIQFTWNGPPDIATWQSSNTAKVVVSAIGQVVALVGGENSNGGDGATLTSVLTTGAAGPTWLVNSPFTIFPRVTTAVWVPVQGAASYDVATEHGNGCGVYANCEIWTAGGGATGLAGSSTTFTFSFVGTQPGRWRVTARDATGAIMPGSPSAWIFFRYIDGL